jgi:hypothetical protein
MGRSQLLGSLVKTSTALNVATIGTLPPVKASMVDITGMRTGGGKGDAPRLARLMIKGGQAGAQTLTGPGLWGWDVATDMPVYLGQLNDGFDITVTNARFWATILHDVLGAFSHLGATGTLSTSEVTLEVTPIETSE